MKSKKTIIFVSIIGIALFAGAIAATSYAYFVGTTQKEGEPTTNVNTAKISANFNGNAEVVGSNIIPGDTVSKTFSLENTGDVTIRYQIILFDVENTFVNTNDLTYTLMENGTEIASGTFPTTSSATKNIISNAITIEKGKTNSYTLTITYNNTDQDQSADMGKSISGKIFIEEV